MRKSPFLEALGKPTCCQLDTIMNYKAEVALLQGHIDALTWVMELPKALYATGEKARELYSEEKDND